MRESDTQFNMTTDAVCSVHLGLLNSRRYRSTIVSTCMSFDFCYTCTVPIKIALGMSDDLSDEYVDKRSLMSTWTGMYVNVER